MARAVNGSNLIRSLTNVKTELSRLSKLLNDETQFTNSKMRV